jgi:hypothetical protein
VQGPTTLPRITAPRMGGGGVARRPGCCDRVSGRDFGWSAPAAVPARPGANPGRPGLAVADGSTTISDIAVLADEAEGVWCSRADSTCWRLLANLTPSSSAWWRMPERQRGRRSVRSAPDQQACAPIGRGRRPRELPGLSSSRLADTVVTIMDSQLGYCVTHDCSRLSLEDLRLERTSRKPS